MPKKAKGGHYPEMMAHRTTKHLESVRTERFWLLLATLLIGLFCTTFGVASGRVDDDIQVRLESASEFAPQWPPDLIIEGLWSSTCLPRIVDTRVVGLHIDIQLNVDAKRCTAASTPFQLKVNPAREAGLPQLPLGVFQVRMFLRHGSGSNELIAFRLLRSGGIDARPHPENGFWWSIPTLDDSPALNGNGLSVEQQGENLAITWLSYEGGRPVWYFGSTPMRGSIARIELLRMIGGGEAFSGPNAAPGIEPGLSMNLQFLSPLHATAWLVQHAALGSD
ncbi:MAG TPA: hypothetical protein VFN25_11130, partial [Dokdonella sp.]|uniref:hypothetical protein n=1 Tax=Dokdonella sp. TaxID=2291710 RepID=UPI002D7ECE47